jgi:CBS domain-containing protein
MKRLQVEVKVPEAREFMNDHVLSFSPVAEVSAAVQKLLRRGYSGAPVVDDDGRVVGILSEQDCLRVLSEAAYEGWPAGVVGDSMTKEVETVDESADVFAIAGKFMAGTHRRFPVVDRDGKLVGLVTRRDLVRALDRFRHEQERARLANTYELIEHRRRTEG